MKKLIKGLLNIMNKGISSEMLMGSIYFLGVEGVPIHFVGVSGIKCTQENGHQYFRGIPSLQTVI